MSNQKSESKKENFEKTKNLITEFIGQDRILTVHRILIDFCDGDILGALFLSQIIYWAGKGIRKDGYFWKTYEEWEAETRINRKKLQRLKKKFETMGIIETKIKKAYGNPTTHYRLKWETFAEKLENFINEKRKTEIDKRALTDDEVDKTTYNKVDKRALSCNIEYPREYNREEEEDPSSPNFSNLENIKNSNNNNLKNPAPQNTPTPIPPESPEYAESSPVEKKEQVSPELEKENINNPPTSQTSPAEPSEALDSTNLNKAYKFWNFMNNSPITPKEKNIIKNILQKIDYKEFAKIIAFMRFDSYWFDKMFLPTILSKIETLQKQTKSAWLLPTFCEISKKQQERLKEKSQLQKQYKELFQAFQVSIDPELQKKIKEEEEARKNY